MSKCHIALGRLGDILNILPILYQEFLATKEPPVLMVSKDFAPLLEGVSYVKPEVFDGGFQELERAYREARGKFDEVVVLGTFGEKVPIHPCTPSFQLDQCLRGQRLEHFGSLPLVFDQRCPDREGKLTKGLGKKPLILVADQGKSAPFAHMADVVKAIGAAFPQHRVLLLSGVKAEKPFDFLGLYEKAKALVSIDTMHLHLSAACNVPVLALARDNPSRWHGSCWQPRYHFHCYYSQWEEKKAEFLKALKNAVEGGKPHHNGHSFLNLWLQEKLIPPISIQAETQNLNLPRSGYNPSIARFKGQTLISYRFHPNRGPKTLLSMFNGHSHKPIKCGDEVSFSFEDMRLFTFKGELYGSYVISTIPATPPYCLVAYGKLVEKEDHWEIVQEFRPKYHENDFSALSKNWVFFEAKDRLCAIQSGELHHNVLELEGEKVVTSHHSLSGLWLYGPIRGGAIVPHGGNFLRFFHSRTELPKMSYYVGAMLLDGNAPYKIITTTKQPLLYGSDWETSLAFHQKPRVVFPSGAIVKDGKYCVAIGVNDCMGIIAKFSDSDLKL